MLLFGAVWLSGFIAQQVDEHIFLRTLEPYFTGHGYKEVMSQIKPRSFLGWLAVLILRLFIAPLELLANAFIPYAQRVESMREALTEAMPHYEEDFSKWANNCLKEEEESS